MARTVVLPREIDTKTTTLASRLQEEVHGVLLYSPVQTLCPIDYLLVTGIGTQSHVQALPRRLDLLNEFFRRNPGYNFVKFHTHSQGTINEFGEYFTNNFSSGDIRSYEEQLKTNHDFIGMVVTPRTKLLYAPDNPTIRVVDGFPQDANVRIHQELTDIARTMGCDLGSLQATRKR